MLEWLQFVLSGCVGKIALDNIFRHPTAGVT